ncbi:hypothetical protein DMR_09750 [Solidesulfovibrio magneticus RS-1]|uniref:Uncharacterized protein n=1 Tax=Solidesulfovibrio magneticus (strain ATCC 700980 / DSM 13731 / RS-1) TaxID=573370 RepID=C4XKS7_SOLM1|nr:hypothetical protein DMR_09750 [Solidesulfovibrio magneticus RS-1]
MVLSLPLSERSLRITADKLSLCGCREKNLETDAPGFQFTELLKIQKLAIFRG